MLYFVICVLLIILIVISIKGQGRSKELTELVIKEKKQDLNKILEIDSIDKYNELSNLALLKDKGSLSEKEFTIEKDCLLKLDTPANKTKSELLLILTELKEKDVINIEEFETEKKSILNPVELRRQLLKSAGEDAITYSYLTDTSWVCICGTDNVLDSAKKIQNCTNCQRNRDFVLDKYGNQ